MTRQREADLATTVVAHLEEIVSLVAPDGTLLSTNHPPDPHAPGEEVGRDSRSWVHPDDEHIVTEAFATLLADPSATTRTLVRVAVGGRPYRHVETTGVNRVAELGGLVFVARDVEEQVQLARAAERALQAQALVADLGVRLLVSGELEPLLGEALARTAALLDAPVLGLVERDAAGELRVTQRLGDGPLEAGHLLALGGQPGADLRELGVVATAQAPLPGPSGSLGALVAAWTEEHDVDEVQRQLLQGVANVLSAARQNARREEAAVARALHDPLTGLPTRPLLLDRLDHALARTSRGGHQVAVLLVDLDRFKDVNDRFGHAAGDAVLAEVGTRLSRHVRPGDTAARFGGDEFVVLCEDVDEAATVQDVAERLREVFAAPFPVPGAGPLVLSGSIGAATTAVCGPDRAALLHAADLAMYADKRLRSG